jgi:CheY-like chemotaxis protein
MTGDDDDRGMQSKGGAEGRGQLAGPRLPGLWLADAAKTGGAWRQRRARGGHGQRHWRVLLLDDDADRGEWLLDELRTTVSAVAWATKGREGMALVSSCAVDLVIAEMGLPDLPGLDLLRALRASPRMPKVILITNRRSDFLATRAIENGASAVMCKPFGGERLLALAAHLLGD